MGHTLVATFDEKFNSMMNDVMEKSGKVWNKVPYGRKCDRSEANNNLPFHVTLYHWKSVDDEKFISRLENFEAKKCKVIVEKSVVTDTAAEGSALLYFKVHLANGFIDMMKDLSKAIHRNLKIYPHMTLAVSKNHDEIYEFQKLLDNCITYPFTLEVDDVQLYEIWDPVIYKKSY